jgi:hypothetical protein
MKTDQDNLSVTSVNITMSSEREFYADRLTYDSHTLFKEVNGFLFALPLFID